MKKNIKTVLISCFIFVLASINFLFINCNTKSIEKNYGFDLLTEKALNYVVNSREILSLTNAHNYLKFNGKSLNVKVIKNGVIANYEDFFRNLSERDTKRKEIEVDFRKKWYHFFSRCEQKINNDLNYESANLYSKEEDLIIFVSEPCQNFIFLMVGKNRKENTHIINNEILYMGEAIEYLFEFDSNSQISDFFHVNVVF